METSNNDATLSTRQKQDSKLSFPRLNLHFYGASALQRNHHGLRTEKEQCPTEIPLPVAMLRTTTTYTELADRVFATFWIAMTGCVTTDTRSWPSALAEPSSGTVRSPQSPRGWTPKLSLTSVLLSESACTRASAIWKNVWMRTSDMSNIFSSATNCTGSNCFTTRPSS